MPLFGRRKELESEVDELKAQLEETGALSELELRRRHDELAAVVAEQETRLAVLRETVAETEEAAVLQEVGVYEYRHPLSDAVAYQAELKGLRDQVKAMARVDGGAILAATNWTVNNSASQGRKMVSDFSKLMLRAYNAEADNLVRGLKPYKVDSAIDRLTKTAATIARLGKTMNIHVSGQYHSLRVRELELTADYLAMKEEEKERDREEKARLREEKKAQQEMERERARLEKEQAHYENALAALVAKGDDEAAARMREQLGEITKAIEDVDYRAANVRAGYVYVVSNLGSFGESLVKIGMTRRLEPRDRIRELSDASVPFNFDVHAVFFAEDAVGIESQLHQLLAERRVNRVNLRREFFRVTPAEVKVHLLNVAGDILEYEEVPEALEYHQSINTA